MRYTFRPDVAIFVSPVVQRPMDLGTVRKQLVANLYACTDNLLDDIELVGVHLLLC